ncbi:MAG: NUDIX domain-containing protein [Elusimicrobia bacterium]|nr:NUDIX domain-containing protein [Elusimicrobiota bacterium]
MVKKKKGMNFEYSAGGVLYDQSKILLIEVENLQGKVVWTFPKGHIETGEDARMAALREVEEETGYVSEIIRELPRVSYHFMRGGILVRKTVRWFLMRPKDLKEIKTKDEVRRVNWSDLSKAEDKLIYPSDLHLLRVVRREMRA